LTGAGFCVIMQERNADETTDPMATL